MSDEIQTAAYRAGVTPPLREGFDPFDPATWTPEERVCYALGFGEADNGRRPRIDDEAPERDRDRGPSW